MDRKAILHKWSFKQMSLRRKLLLASVLCLIVPVFITLGSTGLMTKEVLTEQAGATAIDSLETAERYLANTVGKMIYVTNYLQFDQDVAAIIRENWNAYKSGTALDVAKRVAHVKQVAQKLDAISFPHERMHVTILLPNGTFFTNYPSSEFNPGLFREEAWFGELGRTGSYDAFWIGIHPNYLQSDREDNRYLVTVARTVREFSAEPIAYIIVSMAEKQLSGMFSSAGSMQRIAIIDGSGMTLSSHDQEQIGKPFAHMNLLPPLGKPALATIDGQATVVARLPLPYADWQLVNIVPYAEAVGRLNAMQRSNVLVLVACSILFLAILISIINRLTKPVVRLGRVAAEVESGNLGVRSRIGGDDEIGMLGRSFDQMLDRIEQMIEQVREEQAQKRKAELEMLQAQINPHFLFNVLNSIRMNILIKGDEENAALISSLSVLLRMTINRNNEFVALREETDTVMHYVKLMNFRHKERIDLQVALGKDTLQVPVPRFFLQPLIENAFLHGLDQNKGTIRIESWLDDRFLYVRVEDDGKGMDKERLLALRKKLEGAPPEHQPAGPAMTGIGLTNVAGRLRLIYGSGFKAEIESAPGQGTSITLRLLQDAGGGQDVQRDAGR
jgi:two-component system sensor histidine kinase YesM